MFLQYKNLRPWLWRWHRRLGLASALILILVTLTGILLNHTSDLQLAQKNIQHKKLLSYYGISAQTLTSFKVGARWLSADANGQLYLNSTLIGQCRDKLIAATQYQSEYWVACKQQLLVFNDQAELLDTITALYGLPVPIERMGYCDGALCLSTEQRSFKVDVEQIAFAPLSSSVIKWLSPAALPQPIVAQLHAQNLGQGLSLERVLLDLHSGRIFGSVGVLLFDAAAILLLFLSLSGFVLWYQHHRRKKNRYRK